MLLPLTPPTSKNPISIRRLGIVRSNIDAIEQSAQFFQQHQQLVNPLVDVSTWLNEIEEFRIVSPALSAANSVIIAIRNIERALANDIFESFRRQYHCIQILAADGVPEAMQIWPLMRTVWAHFFGRRGPLCPVKEVVNAVNYANEVVTKNQGRIAEIINSEQLLAKNLTHEIHTQDIAADIGLEEIHKASRDYEELRIKN